MNKKNPKEGEQSKKLNVLRFDLCEPIPLFDREEKIYVRFKLSENKDKWQRWMSKTKKEWTMTHEALTLKEVVEFQEKVVNNNYLRFVNMLRKR